MGGTHTHKASLTIIALIFVPSLTYMEIILTENIGTLEGELKDS